MRRILSLTVLAIGVGLAVGAPPAFAAGGANGPTWFAATPDIPGPGQPFPPNIPITGPEPQPIWVIQVPV